MKCSAIRIDGGWRDAFKDPVTDPGKASKRGRMALLRSRMNGEFMIARREDATAPDAEWEDMLQPVWRNGTLLRDERLATIRERADQAGTLVGPSWAFN